MNHKIILKDKSFTFELINENGGFWYLGKHQFDLFNLGYTTDVTVRCVNFEWSRLIMFLEYVLDPSFKVERKIESTNNKLNELIENVYRNTGLNFNDVVFTLGNIEYLNIDSNSPEFEYIMSFYAESKSDPDFLSYDSWDAYFIGDKMIKVYKS